MRGYARRNFWLGKTVDGAKITNKQSLDRVAQQTGQDPKDLYELPPVDNEILYLFEWFCEVKGSEPLTYQEIETWDKLKGYGVTPEEVEVLMMLDRDFYQSRQDGNE